MFVGRHATTAAEETQGLEVNVVDATATTTTTSTPVDDATATATATAAEGDGNATVADRTPENSNETEVTTHEQEEGQAPDAIELIDSHKALMTAILLDGMGIPADEWRMCLLGMNLNESQANRLKMLVAVWPTPEEERAIHAYERRIDERLGRAEDFHVSLRDIPRTKTKFECLLFKLTFYSRVTRLKGSMITVVRGINQLMESATFDAVMQDNILLFRVMIEGNVALRVRSGGKRFNMSALKLLACDRSVLRVIVEATERTSPHLSAFTEELSLLSASSAVSVDALREELASLEAGLAMITTELAAAKSDMKASTNVEIKEDLIDFYGSMLHVAGFVELELLEVRMTWRELTNTGRRLNEYLEEPEGTPINEIMQPVADFVEAYAAERANITQRRIDQGNE